MNRQCNTGVRCDNIQSGGTASSVSVPSSKCHVSGAFIKYLVSGDNMLSSRC